jgi:hypothetical protein
MWSLKFDTMNQDDKIIASLIAGGAVGAALGVLLTKDKEEGTVLGTLAGAALVATYKANEQARLGNVPVLVEEHGTVYEILPGGERRVVKELAPQEVTVPSNFKLK